MGKRTFLLSFKEKEKKLLQLLSLLLIGRTVFMGDARRKFGFSPSCFSSVLI